jgi:hypothetical protein
VTLKPTNPKRFGKYNVVLVNLSIRLLQRYADQHDAICPSQCLPITIQSDSVLLPNSVADELGVLLYRRVRLVISHGLPNSIFFPENPRKSRVSLSLDTVRCDVYIPIEPSDNSNMFIDPALQLSELQGDHPGIVGPKIDHRLWFGGNNFPPH